MGTDRSALRFAVWAPNAQQVDVVFAKFDPARGSASGYIADDGTGIDASIGQDGAVPLQRGSDDIWTSDPGSELLKEWNAFFERPYMYRIKSEQGRIQYRTDLYSRSQIGRGDQNPHGGPFNGTYKDLDGVASCSMVVDPDLVTADFTDSGLNKQTLISADEFWADEFNHAHMPPAGIEDLIIYELHVGSLNPATLDAGTFSDAIALIPYLDDLGVNAVELMPVLQFDGDLQWGYGTSHYFCLQTSAGGGNQLKHFVKACHQRGIAVILDVVYNHFAQDADRAQWSYDTDGSLAPEHNSYYWYEGQLRDYRDWTGGYVNNGSSGWAPRYWEEQVRSMFVSSAAMLIDEYHIDGIRVDLTGAIHQDNSLNSDGRSLGNANQFGTKLLRELTRTVKLIQPNAFLIAEDHTGWAAMTQPADTGGVGFDAVWYADFYHHLMGDGNVGSNYARLIKMAANADGQALAIGYFAGALSSTQYAKVAYHESHDEAGNGPNTERTIVTAVNGAALISDTRKYAEARCRFSYGIAAMSAGTPMFLMGEEVGSAKPFRTTDFNRNKEDLLAKRIGDGRYLFRFYQDLTNLVRLRPSLRSRSLDVLYVHNENRVLAFRRVYGAEQALVIASLNDVPFSHGYFLQTDARLPDGLWREVFSSDASVYGGDNVGNYGAAIPSTGGAINLIIPAHGFIVLLKES